MSVGRLWRTVRHLNADQWRTRLTRRGGHALARLAPDAWAGRLQRRAGRLALPDPAAAALAGIADQVLADQSAVHGDHLDAMAAGRFTFVGHTEDFGAPGGVEWRREAAGANTLLWRLNLGYMSYVVPWLASGDDEDAARAVTMVRSLEAQNPWHAAGVLRDIWNPYTASHRLINLLAGLHLHGRAGGVLADDENMLIHDHLRKCAAYIAGNLEKDLQFNHLLKNYTALAVYAAALPNGAVPWAFLEPETMASVRQNFLGDGGHAERSPMYHLLGLRDLRLLRGSALFPDRWGPMLDEAIAKAVSALTLMSHPDGDIALFNDSWFGEAPPASTLINTPPPAGRHDLAETGYVRLDGGADVVIVDAGPCGPDENPAHAHADFLSLEASIRGQRFLVDPGTAAYAPGPLRDRCRSAAQHNGPHVAGAEPIEFWHSFRVGRRGRARTLPGFDDMSPLAVAGSHDGYSPLGIEVSRFVGLWPDQGIVIVDCWRGHAGECAATRFLVPAAWRAGGGEEPTFKTDQATVRVMADAGTLGAIAAAEWWPRFGEASPAHEMVVRPETFDGGQWAAVRFFWGDGSDVAAADVAAIRDRLIACH